jgi:hypothetical protein
METSRSFLVEKGKEIPIYKTNYNNIEIIIRGKFLKYAYPINNGMVEIFDPKNVIEYFDNMKNIRVDYFQFMQKIPNSKAVFKYYFVYDNLAAIPIESYSQWWSKQINGKTRNMVRKSKKSGIEIKSVNFDKFFVENVHTIFNESPVRQGKKFWHFGKSIEVINRQLSVDSKSHTYLGAFYKNEMIGFAGIRRVDDIGFLGQIISMIKHRDKAPNNALIDHSVLFCEKNNINYLIYDKFDYGKGGSDTLKRFKKDNGFQKYELPKYFLPITSFGKFVCDHKLHLNFTDFIPQPLYNMLRTIRKKIYS